MAQVYLHLESNWPYSMLPLALSQGGWVCPVRNGCIALYASFTKSKQMNAQGRNQVSWLRRRNEGGMGARILETYHRIQRLVWFCLWKRLRPESGSPLWPTLSIFWRTFAFSSITLTHSAHSCVLHIQPHRDWLNSWLVRVLNSPKWKWEWLCVGYVCAVFMVEGAHPFGEGDFPSAEELDKCLLQGPLPQKKGVLWIG